MYLKTLALTDFRSFERIEIPFCSDLTILVGENNGGKSNAIDAIRLLTAPLSGRRELYCETTDIRFDSPTRKFEITGDFENLSSGQKGRLISVAADSAINACRFGLTYDETSGRFPVRPALWGGLNHSPPEPGCHEMVRHVYLPPLRDAKRALASGNPTRIYALLNHFLGDRDPDTIAKELRRDTSAEILGQVSAAVELGLHALSSGVRRQSASLGFANDEKLIDIARDLRFKLSDHGLEPEDLRYSGHGYANLLYMSAIAVELEKASDADLTIFLVEEPEAHLHPQLQAAVLNFLEEQAQKSRYSQPNSGTPAGQLQVIVATHSPNFTAWVESKKVVFFRSCSRLSLLDEKAKNLPEPSDEPPKSGHTRRVTRCIPLAGLSLDPIDRRKIDRYLDVTKSALLFGGRILLAEGIAEALLLPVIAKKLIFKQAPDKLRLFRSAVFVPIDGVDFGPYTKLLVTSLNGARIADRLVIITDGDSGSSAPNSLSPGALRKVELETIASAAGASAILEVFTNEYSLESEIFLAGNHDLMKSTYLKLHKRSEDKWNEAVAHTDQARAAAIQALFKSTRKGDFAQLLAEAINDDYPFHVPLYIEQAINAIVQ